MFQLAALVIIVCTSLVLGGNELLYPDLRCHKGYNDKTGNSEAGSGKVLDVMRICKRSGTKCYKQCVMIKHGIIEEDDWENERIKLRDQGQMAHYLKVLFTDRDAAKKLEKRIYLNCINKASSARDGPCTSPKRLELEACIEKAWAC